jgi:hypothetical protein
LALCFASPEWSCPFPKHRHGPRPRYLDQEALCNPLLILPSSTKPSVAGFTPLLLYNLARSLHLCPRHCCRPHSSLAITDAASRHDRVPPRLLGSRTSALYPRTPPRPLTCSTRPLPRATTTPPPHSHRPLPSRSSRSHQTPPDDYPVVLYRKAGGPPRQRKTLSALLHRHALHAPLQPGPRRRRRPTVHGQQQSHLCSLFSRKPPVLDTERDAGICTESRRSWRSWA